MASKMEIDPEEIIRRINRHIRIYRISYFVAFGYFFSWAISNLHYSFDWKFGDDFHWIIYLPIMIIIIINFLLIPVVIYYCITIDRFLKILDCHYNLNIWLCRTVIYSLFLGLIVCQVSTGILQIILRINDDLLR